MDVAAGIITLIPILAIKGYVLFGILCIGAISIQARTLFIWMCPTLLKLSKPLVIYINLIIDFLEIFVDALIVVIDAIIKAVSFFSGHSGHLIHWVHMNHISDQQFRRVVSEIPPLCKRYDNMPVIFQFLVRHNIHEYTCPAVSCMLHFLKDTAFYSNNPHNIYFTGALHLSVAVVI